MIEIIDNKCDFCGTCAGVCPVNCINVEENDIIINHQTCINCDLCVFICPIEVLKSVEV